jgi:CYTH domain-containing protein
MTAGSSPQGTEIERKFLVGSRPDDLDRHPAELIEQGYLAVASDGVEVRIRRRGERTVLTVKSGPGEVRAEEEVPIEPHQFDRLWPLTEGRRITKTRFLVPVGPGLSAEVDVYDGALDGLVTAEIEFTSREASRDFSAPGWLGEEVTDDPRYANQVLARDGPP